MVSHITGSTDPGFDRGLSLRPGALLYGYMLAATVWSASDPFYRSTAGYGT